MPYTFPKSDGRYFVKVSYQLAVDLPWAKAGHDIAFHQFELPVARAEKAPMKALPFISCEKDDRCITVIGRDFRYVFDRLGGTIVKMEYRGLALLTEKPSYTIWRAPTDNDRNEKNIWYRHRYHQMQTHVYSVDITDESDSEISIAVCFSMGAFSKLPILRGHAIWTIRGNGEILLDTNVNIQPDLPFLPRFGLKLTMPKGNERVEYFGYGPHESYIDKRRSTWKSRFETTVDQMHENYLYPQENGSHYGTEWACVTNALGMGLLFTTTDQFSFNASHYTPENLTEAMHPHELVRKPETIIHLDCAMSGMGSNSCGPRLLPQYQIAQRELGYKIRILPICKNEVCIDDLT